MNMNQPLLTVIVPCYNVEKYVDKCISSIVNQAYTHLEILLIDDGSLDRTGMICDAWQERDSRISVIHKQNEGLAYARKTGIEHTTAEYVAFVDADDWIDLNMYADLMEALLTTDSDIAQCSVCEVYEDGRMNYLGNKQKNDSVEQIGRIDGVLLILKDDWHSWMGTKIYKKYLFEGIEFPKGRGFGEDYISHYLFHKVTQSVFVHRHYYFYLQRNSSITKSKNIAAEMKKISDFSDAYYDRYCFTVQHSEYHEALPFVKYMTVYTGIHLLRNMIALPQYFAKDNFSEKAKQMRLISLTKADKLRRGVKIDLHMLNISSGLYIFIRSLYVRLIKLTNHLKITKRQTSFSITDLFGWWQ